MRDGGGVVVAVGVALRKREALGAGGRRGRRGNAGSRIAGNAWAAEERRQAGRQEAGWLVAGCWLLAAGCWLLAAGRRRAAGRLGGGAGGAAWGLGGRDAERARDAVEGPRG